MKTDKTRSTGRDTRRRATLKTISELTGLSLSTVSLSLRGGTALKEETRQRVAEAARQVGYVPDRAGVRLRTGKTNVIALVLGGTRGSIDFTQDIIQGIGKAIADTRYHLTVSPAFEGGEALDSVRYILDNRTADGVIITHTGPRDKRVQMLMEADFPFVTHGRTEFFSPHAYHDFDSERFMTLAVERLAGRGCKDIMLSIGNDSTNNYHLIVSSFRRAVAQHNVSGREMPEAIARSPSEALRRFAETLAGSPDRPDGIICDGELRAMALLSGLRNGANPEGRAIRVVCKQTSDVLPTLFPDVDTIEENVFDAGTELTRLLLRRIAGEAPEALQTLGAPVVRWRG